MNKFVGLNLHVEASFPDDSCLLVLYVYCFGSIAQSGRAEALG